MEDEAEAGIGGMVALVMGIVALVVALFSLLTSLVGGVMSMCCLCAPVGWIAAVIPILAGVFAFAAFLWAVIAYRQGAVNDEDSNPTFAMIGIALSMVAMVLDFVSVLIASWTTILWVFAVVMSAIVELLSLL